MGRLIQLVAIALALFIVGSPAVADDLKLQTHSQAAEAGAVEALSCVPGGCDDQPPACTIPREHCAAALYVYEFAVSHNYSPPPGLRGGSVFRNTNGKLPPGGDYLEYRIYSTPGSAERIVIDRNTNDAWFTGDHYATFEELKRLVLAGIAWQGPTGSTD